MDVGGQPTTFNQTPNYSKSERLDSHAGLSSCDERETTQTLG